jgi:GT2 family glycosyltransferase/glycosyltransferase involved in cell wall biosynthesis
VNDLPAVSVVTLNLNGRSLLGDCLDSLAAQDYPRDRFEVILVDNGSTDDSVPYVQEAYPWVRIFEAGRNLGFAGGNDLGVRMATGDYVAFINNDARADPHWLRAMVDVLETDPQIACAASKMLGQDGKRIDFVGTGMNLYGRAFQVDAGLPVAPGFHDETCDALAPCGGAMMIRRDVFEQVGGFDEDFVAYFEDIDLGWRLWILGYRVLFVPAAIVYHKLHKTGGRFPVEQRYTLTETNALRLLIKNCEEKNLWQVLSFSLFMGVRRSVEQAGLDRQRYQFGYLVPGDTQAGVFEPETRMTRVATSFLLAIDQIAEGMPRLLEKRRLIQAARVRSDEEIFTRFPLQTDNPIFPWRRYQVVQDELIASLGVPDALKPRHGSRLLIITHESIGPNMAGPGIRAWEMACALSERFDVLLAAPGEPSRHHPGVRVVGYETEDPFYPSLDPYLKNADVVLAMGPLFARIPRLQDLGKPTIVDLYDPFELEKLAQSPTMEEEYHLRMDLESTGHLRLEGAAGDFFICASERQRDFWLGMLLASGRVNTVTYTQDPTLCALIDVVPFGMPPEPPRKTGAVLKGIHPGIAAEDRLLLWNGGLWQWLDPLTLIDALAQVVTRRDDVKLFFAAGKHFDPETVPEMPIYEQTVTRCRELGLLDRHVFFGDWIPYDDRGDYLLEADLGVSTHRPILESRFAARTRLVDCVWAGLPVISTTGDPLSDMLAECGLARTVPPGRPDLLATTILEMLADEGLRDRVGGQAQRLRGGLAWTRCVEPIASFLDRVAFAPDALAAIRRAAQARQMAQHIQEMAHHIQDLELDKQGMQDYIGKLESHIEAINQGRVMRLMNALKRGRS